MTLQIGHIYRNKTNSFNINLYTTPQNDLTAPNRWTATVYQNQLFMPVAKMVFRDYVAWKVLCTQGLGWWHVYGPDDGYALIIEEVTPDNDEIR